MKKAKKTFLAVACAGALVVGSVAATMAYLTATTDSVVNTFTVGNVSFNEDMNGGLDEAKVDQYGEPVKDADRVTSNKYKLIPGHEYTKDPTVHMGDDSEEAYVFVKVVNAISSYEAGGDTATIAEQMDALGWKAVEGQTNVYAYYGTTTTDGVTTVNGSITPVKAKANLVVFKTFTLADDADVSKIVTEGDNADKITVTAYAVQADGFDGKTAAEIWAEAGFTA